MVCLEALASKTPVIVSNTGRMKDFIEENKTGIVINNIQPESFAKNIINFFNDETKIDFDENYYKKIESFEWEKVFKNLYKFFD